MSFAYQKVKSVAKQVTPKGEKLENVVLTTMGLASKLVGATLGPGGMPVLIERQEHGLPPMITKDGVTVFRALGFDDAAGQCIMEAARDAAVRPAAEAGDGTTTATVLAEAIVRNTYAFTKANPRVSPQKVVRRLERAFREVIEPTIRSCSIEVQSSNDEGQRLLHSVAKVSANGDTDLADAVLKCFELVGDDGNVTIAEVNGPSAYEVERIEGFPIGMGYEDSCAKFYGKFVNDPANQRVLLDNPVFLVYHGRVTEIQSLVSMFEKVGTLWQSDGTVVEDGEVVTKEDWKARHNVVLVATGFSESVLAQLAINFAHQTTINVFPLLAPVSPIANGQQKFLEDVACITGATLLDPLNAPIDKASVHDLGYGDGLTSFEANRFRSTIFGHVSEDEILVRSDELRANIANAESELDRQLLEERLGKLTGGIAKLKVVGASNGELKEKRDRAEDAVCAVRGAIRHGCLPGGGWMLLALMHQLKCENDPIVTGVLIPALFEPVARLLLNCGVDEVEAKSILEPVLESIVNVKANGESPVVYDALECKHVDAIEGGILDSTPAVLEAVRNSISIAALLGTLGGTVVFKRDAVLERQEASDTNAFVRDASSNPADDRA